MSKTVSAIFISSFIFISLSCFADAELNKCLGKNQSSPDRYQNCYGQLKTRAQEQRKEELEQRFEKNKEFIQQQTIKTIQKVAKQKQSAPMAQPGANTYQSGSVQPQPTTRQIPTQPKQTQQTEQPSQPELSPAKPKGQPVIQYY